MDTPSAIAPSSPTSHATPRRSIYHEAPYLMLRIWRLVIPDRRPGVQVFTLEPPPSWYEDNPQRRPYSPRWQSLQAPRVAPNDGGYGWYFRAAHTVAPSWDANNPSTYLVASGLWTACKQSRRLMQETYETATWDQYRHMFPDLVDFAPGTDRDKLARMPATLHVRDRGKDRYFTVFPHDDLFYFQSMDLTHCPWTFPTPLGAPITLRNEKAIPRAVSYFAKLAAHVPSDTVIWFVDYRLKRVHLAPTRAQQELELARCAFYGSDRRYVEVMGVMPPAFDRYHMLDPTLLPMLDPPPLSPFTPGLGQNWRWVEDLRQGGGAKLSGAWFIKAVHNYLKYLAENQPEGSRRLDGTEGERLGLLACEFF
ncbi:hypothetical protein J3F83DRAFT_769475 [Trichoderma novae-zelandiae]